MGRGKIQIKRIENRTARQVTFAKRRVGLLKKAMELSVLCDAEIGLIIFSTNGKLFEFCSESSSMKNIIRKYQVAKGPLTRPENFDLEQMHNELKRMKNDTDNLELSMQCYTGEDLSPLQYDDLLQLENQLECSIHKVQARKFEIFQQQAETSQRKLKMLEEEHGQMHHLMMNGHQAAIEQQEAAAVAAMAMKADAQRRGMNDEFPFFEEEGPSSVLQLAPYPLQYQSYRVQPSQPNLLDFTLHHPSYD